MESLRHRFPRVSAWAARRVDTSSPAGSTLSLVVLAGVICAWVFIGLTQDVVAHEESSLTDPSVTTFVVAHRIGWATAAMKILTWLGFSRLYLGVHWWTDVVAGFALGGVWLCILGAVELMTSKRDAASA